jgi:pyrroloquinoline quinone biosynthesis protein B
MLSHRSISLCVLLVLITLTGMRRQHTTPAATRYRLCILGIAQDAGYPQAGCSKNCCKRAWQHPQHKRFVASIAIADYVEKKWWLFDATPDIREQLQLFEKMTAKAFPPLPEGIFLTHGHIGHYTGLMQLGREVMNTRSLPVYVLPRMKDYLTQNGPWRLLVALQNIALHPLQSDSVLTAGTLRITPFLVPHRDEFTETAGYRIETDNKSVLFIPDIDKWEKFGTDIRRLVQECNIALLDGTFYKDGELPGRPMHEVPHPFVTESMQLFDTMQCRRNIWFIHLNHTNPLLDTGSPASKRVRAKGYHIATQGEEIAL